MSELKAHVYTSREITTSRIAFEGHFTKLDTNGSHADSTLITPAVFSASAVNVESKLFRDYRLSRHEALEDGSPAPTAHFSPATRLRLSGGFHPVQESGSEEQDMDEGEQVNA